VQRLICRCCQLIMVCIPDLGAKCEDRIRLFPKSQQEMWRWHGRGSRLRRSSRSCVKPKCGSHKGETAGKICRGARISEQNYYKWRREYRGLKIDQAKRLKEPERENERLKKAVSELTLDKQILKEALSGKY
jgi:putative transposase